MNILLCLLSDQHVPNLLAVHHYQPDHLVLVASAVMERKKAAAHLLAALKKGGLDYDSRCHIQPLAAEDDLARIRAALQAAYGLFSASRWIASVTGGTKPMSIATYEFFKALGGKTVYTNSSQPDRIVDLESGHVEACTHRPTIDEFVTGYGFHPQKPVNKLREAAARAERPLWRRTANLLAAQETATDVLHLDEEQRAQARNKGIELPAERFNFPSQDLRKEWLGGEASRKLTKDEGEFLTGGWLEVFFYNLLSRHADAIGIWDVTLGHNITSDLGQNAVPNDIDVSFMHNHGMAMVECKSGTQEHDLSRGMDTLYKIEAVARQLRALRVRSFFVTTGTNVLDKEGKIRAALESRAELYNCRVLSREQITELASMVVRESPDVVTHTRGLFRL